MNIFLREIKANLKALFIWSGVVVFYMIVGLTKFSGFMNNPEMLEILDSMPPAILSAFNMNAFNLTTLNGFYGVIFSYITLIVTIHAVFIGSGIILKEERDKTVEFSLTLPISRQKLITSKIFAAVFNCIVLLLVILISNYLSVLKYEPDEIYFKFVAVSMIALFCLQMIFLSIGVLLACAMKQYKRASSAAVAILLITYFMSIITDFTDKLEFFKYISPFKFFNPVSILNELAVNINYVLISLGIVVVCLIGGYTSYLKRDLYV